MRDRAFRRAQEAKRKNKVRSRWNRGDWDCRSIGKMANTPVLTSYHARTDNSLASLTVQELQAVESFATQF